MAKLFIVGFPKDMEEIELVEMFSVYGTVNTVTIVTDKDTRQSKGYGFITMTDQAGADRAIAAMDGAEIDDRRSVFASRRKRAHLNLLLTRYLNLIRSAMIVWERQGLNDQDGPYNQLEF